MFAWSKASVGESLKERGVQLELPDGYLETERFVSDQGDSAARLVLGARVCLDGVKESSRRV